MKKASGTTKACVVRYDWIRRMLMSGTPLNCTEIAHRLNITTKTAQRYIVRLREDGYQITYNPDVRGYTMLLPDDPQPNPGIIKVLKSAHQWAKRHKINAPWVQEAKKLLEEVTHA